MPRTASESERQNNHQKVTKIDNLINRIGGPNFVSFASQVDIDSDLATLCFRGKDEFASTIPVKNSLKYHGLEYTILKEEHNSPVIFLIGVGFSLLAAAACCWFCGDMETARVATAMGATTLSAAAGVQLNPNQPVTGAMSGLAAAASTINAGSSSDQDQAATRPNQDQAATRSNQDQAATRPNQDQPQPGLNHNRKNRRIRKRKTPKRAREPRNKKKPKNETQYGEPVNRN